jgi:hypothetical protein
MAVGNIVALTSFGNTKPINLSFIDLPRAHHSDNNAGGLNDSFPHVIAHTDCSCQFLLLIAHTDCSCQLLIPIALADCSYRLLLPVAHTDCSYQLLLTIALSDCS